MKIVIKIVLLVGVIGYLIFGICSLSRDEEKRICSGVEILINDSIYPNFVDVQFIKELLTLTQKPVKDIPLKQIDIKYNPQQANYKPPFVKKISEKIAKIISDAIVPNRSKIEDKTRDVTFGNLFGKIFLKNVLAKKGGRANEGMEKGNNSPTVSPGVRSRRNTTASDSVSYTPDGKVIIAVHLSASKNKLSKGCRVELQVQSATGAMSVNEWFNQVGTLLPFNIESITPSLKSLDGHKCSDSKLLKIDNLYSRDSEVYGFTLSFKDDEEHSYISDIELELNIRMRESKPSIYVSDLE